MDSRGKALLHHPLRPHLSTLIGKWFISTTWGCSCGSVGKNPPAMKRDLDLIPGLGRSLEKGKATHFSILAWRIPWTTAHGVTKSRTRLSDFQFHFQLLEIVSFKWLVATIWIAYLPEPGKGVRNYDFWTLLVQFSSAIQSCLTFCNPMDCSTPGLPSHQVAKVLEFQLQHQSFQWILRTDFL